MPFEDEEYLNLPRNADLAQEPQGFEYLALTAGAEPEARQDAGEHNKPFTIALLSSVVIHSLLILGFMLFIEWRTEPLELKSLPSFDVSLTGFEPAPESKPSEQPEAQRTEDALSPDTQTNPQAQSPAPLQSIEEFTQQIRVLETAGRNPAELEVSRESQRLKQPSTESVETSAIEIGQHAPENEDSVAVVTTAAPTVPTVVASSEQQRATTPKQAPVADSAPRANIVPTRALSSNQLDALETQIKQWQQDLYQQLQQSEEISWSDRGQVYTATLTEVPAQSSTDIDRADITVTTSVDGRTLETTMQMKRLAFSHYGQFVNQWGRDMYLHQDEIEGRFHSNSTINIQVGRRGGPVFHGPVTTAYEIDVEGRARRSKMFLNGLETRVGRISLPEQAAPVAHSPAINSPEPAVSEEQLQFIDGDATVVFYSDGSFSWQYEDSAEVQRRTVTGSEFYIVASEDSVLRVKGVVKGRVVVYTPEEISIIGDIRYASDPEMNALSTDFLGLISEKYIEVASPKITGPGDLTVYAAIYAKRRFSVRRFTNNNKGLLTIYGSLSAGSLSASEPRYATLLRFDPRFEQQRPPGFPMTQRYELDHWNRQWRAVD